MIKNDFMLYHGNCFDMMDRLIDENPEGLFDLIVADPPYFLSNAKFTALRGGKKVQILHGDWDVSQGPEKDHEFNLGWLERCHKLLKKDGAIWVSGTHHSILSAGFAMQKLGFRIINQLTWAKPNPPPLFPSVKRMVCSTETFLWASKSAKSRHQYHGELAREIGGGKGLRDVWNLQSAKPSEKTLGRHSCQKPIDLIKRIVELTSSPGDIVFDPFAGSGTTGVACALTGRRFVGIDMNPSYVDLSARRIHDATLKVEGLKLSKPRIISLGRFTPIASNDGEFKAIEPQQAQIALA